ncbi:hypothetical protein HII31_01241 [Pseudocercospora fuligena]|uniref:Uncharacterized protein n=1 Tax=Pseudocercospora fuligena TaxID=685502 RepID=A0A8H6RS50_9PEZI|nr:hypothetical protein HII31_01241 [Pseudocercospora fuligena]
MKSYQALPAFATIALAIEPYHGTAYGGNSRGVVDYTYANLPLLNVSEYTYQEFNWSGPAQDNGYWVSLMGSRRAFCLRHLLTSCPSGL